MTVRKLAISVPERVAVRVDAAAKRRGLTRSGLIALVLDRVARAERDAAVTEKVNEALADLDLQREQKTTAAELHRASVITGTEW
jgi:hypothetical protein